MKSFFQYILIVTSVILGNILTACSDIDSEDSPETETGDVMLYLHVAMASQKTADHTIQSRADNSAQTTDLSAATGNNEKMHELRIIIVRSNSIVEHNDYISEPFLNRPDIYAGTFQYRVKSYEKKYIYLIANENATRTDMNGTQIKMVDYDFSNIIPGTSLNSYDINSLLINLGSDSETLNGILPMSECHTVDIPYAKPQLNPTSASAISTKLYIRRAAVKFSINITNSSTFNDYDIEELRIDKLSRKEYFLPRDTKYNGNGEIIDYQVPNIDGNEYYTFKRSYENITVNKDGGKQSLPAFYLLEGKYSDPNKLEGSDLNYSLTLKMNGKDYTERLPNLPQLPRNTHVVINIDIKDNEIALQVDLRPYSSVELKPSFGLDYPEG